MDDAELAKLLEVAKVAVGREHGLDEPAARRLAGSSVEELHRDAASYARELGVADPTVRDQARDQGGRFAGADNVAINEAIRAAAGR
jgi:hypothetical protein